MTLKEHLQAIIDGDMDNTQTVAQAVLEELTRLERALADAMSYSRTLEREIERLNEKPVSEG